MIQGNNKDTLRYSQLLQVNVRAEQRGLGLLLLQINELPSKVFQTVCLCVGVCTPAIYSASAILLPVHN